MLYFNSSSYWPWIPQKPFSSQWGSIGLKRHWWLLFQTSILCTPPPTPQGTSELTQLQVQWRVHKPVSQQLGYQQQKQLAVLGIIMRGSACLWIHKLGLEPISSLWNKLTTKKWCRIHLGVRGQNQASVKEEARKKKPGRLCIWFSPTPPKQSISS